MVALGNLEITKRGSFVDQSSSQFRDVPIRRDLDALRTRTIIIGIEFGHSRCNAPVWSLERRGVFPRNLLVQVILCLALINPSGSAAPAEGVQQTSEKVISVDRLPHRLNAVSLRSDWGLNKSFRLSLRLRNDTGRSWVNLQAKGDCSCSVAEIDRIPDSGVQPQKSALVRVLYTKPKEPGITQTRIRFTINERHLVLPVIVEWYSPVSVQKLQQVRSDTWQARGTVHDGWTINSIACLNDDARVVSFSNSHQDFSIDLAAKIQSPRNCWLRFELEATKSGKLLEQDLKLYLESAAARIIPTRLICQLTEEGALTGSARIFFPRTGFGPKPKLTSCALVAAEGAEVSLTLNQKTISKAAIKVDFATDALVMRDALVEGARIRFEFDDETQLNCPFLVSSE